MNIYVVIDLSGFVFAADQADLKTITNLHAVTLLQHWRWNHHLIIRGCEYKRKPRVKQETAFFPLLKPKKVTLSMSRFSEVTLKRPLCCTTGGFDLSSDSSWLADTNTNLYFLDK